MVMLNQQQFDANGNPIGGDDRGSGGGGVGGNNNALYSVSITPRLITLNAGVVQTFTATGWNVNGNAIAIKPRWSVPAVESGTITSNGVFTAGDVPGTYDNAVMGMVGDIAGYATVTVRASGIGDTPPPNSNSLNNVLSLSKTSSDRNYVKGTFQSITDDNIVATNTSDTLTVRVILTGISGVTFEPTSFNLTPKEQKNIVVHFNPAGFENLEEGLNLINATIDLTTISTNVIPVSIKTSLTDSGVVFRGFTTKETADASYTVSLNPILNTPTVYPSSSFSVWINDDNGTHSSTDVTIGQIVYNPVGTNWLRVTGNRGSTKTDITLNPNAYGLTAGTYSAVVPIISTVAGISNSPTNISVIFLVSSAPVVVVAISVSGNNQIAKKGTMLAKPIEVQVMRNGVPYVGHIVYWTANHGGKVPFSTVTDNFGYTEIYWSLGADAGVQELLARPEVSTASSDTTVATHFYATATA